VNKNNKDPLCDSSSKQSERANPQPATRNPQPATRNPQPVTPRVFLGEVD